jgi:hypothetical protein
MSVQNLKNPLTKNYLDYKNYVLAEGNIPWFTKHRTHFYSENERENQPKDIFYFSHTIVDRPYQETPYRYPVPKIDSNLFEQTYKIFKEILDFNNISLNVVYRLNINLTPHQTLKKSISHTDLPFAHNVLILYFTTTSGKTYIEINNKQHTISAEEDKIIIFNGEYNHFQGTPKIDEKRIVLVANYI